MNQNIIKWGGNILIMISALTIAFFPQVALHWPAFAGYVTGAVVWTWFAYKIKDYPLMFLNLFYVGIDVYAILIRL